MWTDGRVFDKNASSVDFVLEFSRVVSMLSTIKRFFPTSKMTLFRKFALLTKKLILKCRDSYLQDQLVRYLSDFLAFDNSHCFVF